MPGDLKLSVPSDCGNAPKKAILRDFHIAFVTKNYNALLEHVADDMTWTIVGDETVQGKEAFMHKLNRLIEDPITELVLDNIITHGYTAAANGKMIGPQTTFDFCYVYRFAGASKTAKIKTITSYILT